MTKVTVASGERACEAVWERAPSRVGSTICIGSSPKGLQKTYHFRFVGEKPGPMSSADCPTRRLRFFRTCFLLNALIVSIVILPAVLCGQSSNSSSNSSSTGGPAPVPTPQVSTSQVQTSAQNPVFGSVPEAKPTPGVLSLTFSDAIERALRQNNAGLLSENNTIEARGETWQKLSDLLPNVNGSVQEAVHKQSLEALGLSSALFPGGAKPPRVIGPFDYFDVRASATERLFDWKAIQKYRSSVVGESVTRFNLKDARDLVVLATGNAYLQAIAGAARVETAQAQVETASASSRKAGAQHIAGGPTRCDPLRAQVEYQSRQQQLIAATRDFAKQKISVARVIGLAPGQEFELANKSPYQAFPIPDLETSLQRAYSLRSDYKA